MKYDVFISYRRDNGAELARSIDEELRFTYGLKCYLDVNRHKAGNFDEQIIDAINNSSYFILIESKDALNECVKENDWVRREIIEATGKCTIIPVIRPEFRWPDELEAQFPPEIIKLKHQQGVKADHEYFPSMMQKLIQFMKGVTIRLHKPSVYSESSNFISDKIDEISDIVSVDMAFHSGGEWHRNSEMVDSMSKLLSIGCPVRILINSPKSVEPIAEHMSQKGKHYDKFKANVAYWKEFASQHPDNIQVRIANVPLLHRTYIVRGKDDGSASIKYYTYGNGVPEKDFRTTFDYPSFEYKLYEEEFDYLWNISKEN